MKKLIAVSKEFNIGPKTLVAFLNSQGFSVVNSPLEKISEEMYNAIIQGIENGQLDLVKNIENEREPNRTKIDLSEIEKPKPRFNTQKVNNANEPNKVEKRNDLDSYTLKGLKVMGKLDFSSLPQETEKKEALQKIKKNKMLQTTSKKKNNLKNMMIIIT